jgi:hypothetical protein
MMPNRSFEAAGYAAAQLKRWASNLVAEGKDGPTAAELGLDNCKSLKQAIDAGRVPGPKMHATGPYLEGVGSFAPQMHELTDAADARNTADYRIGEGTPGWRPRRVARRPVVRYGRI